jgi:hypothetical protein
LPEPEREALKELLEAAITRSDAGSIVPRPLPSETRFMLMLIHIDSQLNRVKDLLAANSEK